jgi:hypothetical protein
MKKSLLLSISAACALIAAADETAPSVMDLRNGEFTYNEDGSWTDVYSSDANTFDVDIFSANHYGSTGYYYGSLPCTSTSNVNQENFLTNQWGCMAGGAVKVDDNGNVVTTDGKIEAEAGAPYVMTYWSEYMEAYSSMTAAIFLSTESAMAAKEIYVCNQPYAYYVALNGDAYSRKLDQKGDVFKLLIHGINEDYVDNGKVVEHTLISAVDNGDGTYTPTGSTEWQRVDLSELGNICGIYVTMTSTDSGEWGMNTPAYVCLDRFTVAPANESGVTNVEMDNTANADAVYYTIQGVRTSANNLTPGVYVKVVNNHASKVQVR